MRLNLYEDKNTAEERVDIYYSSMRPAIKQIIDIANSDRGCLKSSETAPFIYGNKKRVPKSPFIVRIIL